MFGVSGIGSDSMGADSSVLGRGIDIVVSSCFIIIGSMVLQGGVFAYDREDGEAARSLEVVDILALVRETFLAACFLEVDLAAPRVLRSSIDQR